MQILQSYKSVVQTIAAQCPQTGGNAVYLARSLYSLVNDTLYFDDDAICSAAGLRLDEEFNTLSKNIETTFTLYPNPANEVIQLTGLLQEEVNTIELINSIGIRLLQHTSKLSNIKLDVSNYPNGIYFVRVSNSVRTEIFKLTINR